jgi:hypothetical protein
MLGSACLAGRLEARPSLTHQFDGDRLPEGVPAPLVDDVIDEVHRLGASLGGGHGPRQIGSPAGASCARERAMANLHLQLSRFVDAGRFSIGLMRCVPYASCEVARERGEDSHRKKVGPTTLPMTFLVA